MSIRSDVDLITGNSRLKSNLPLIPVRSTTGALLFNLHPPDDNRKSYQRANCKHDP
jgi:hypothetical protein